jgi:hypothetical protein
MILSLYFVLLLQHSMAIWPPSMGMVAPWTKSASSHVTQIITHTSKLDDAIKVFEVVSDPSLAIKVALDLA